MVVVSFACNQLKDLPANIGKLSNLRELDLAENQLTALPAEIGCLTQLERLDLLNNKLTILAREISSLTKLDELSLDGNPLIDPSSDIVDQGVGAILVYLGEKDCELK
jgi:Leucine-rich repeat (LRR) protein